MIPNYLYAIKFNNSYKSSRPNVDITYNFKKLPMKLICTLINKCYIAKHYDNNTVDITAKVTHIVITHTHTHILHTLIIADLIITTLLLNGAKSSRTTCAFRAFNRAVNPHSWNIPIIIGFNFFHMGRRLTAADEKIILHGPAGYATRPRDHTASAMVHVRSLH